MMTRRQRLAKRALDIGLASLLIVPAAPVIAACAIAARRDTGASGIFRQERIGLFGRPFTVYKIRTMRAVAGTTVTRAGDVRITPLGAWLRRWKLDELPQLWNVLRGEMSFVGPRPDVPGFADRLEAELRAEDAHTGALWKRKDDPRVTPVGRLIRKYSIDELPQLFNVLKGEMSLVGPRPQQAWEVDSYTSDTHRRLAVKPGITGLWQVSGRSELSWDETIRLDLYYVDNWSMVSDLVIMAKTVRAVFASSGAY